MKKSLHLIFTVVLLSGCATSIKTLYDHQADFTQYKTFCWMNGCEFAITGPSYLNDSLLRENIKKAIVSELNKKGLILNNDEPDLLVSFNITVKNQQAILYHRENDVPYFRPVDTEPQMINYLEGTIVIGMADKKESKVVWESFASRYMEEKPDLSEKNIARGIHLILKKFPTRKPEGGKKEL